MQQREAHAKETEAKAAEARAEADRKQAEAERLEAEATERQHAAEGYREQHADHLRQADELDPDVDTKQRRLRGSRHRGCGGDGVADAGTGPRTAGDVADGTTATETHHEHGVDGHADGDRVHDRLGGQDTSRGRGLREHRDRHPPRRHDRDRQRPGVRTTADGGTHRA